MTIKRGEVTEDVGFSMTPMIDIVFQLILFFMLATDFSQKDLEAVILPDAVKAVEDKNPPKDRMTINVCHMSERELGAPCDAFVRSASDPSVLCIDPAHWVVKVHGRILTDRQLEDLVRIEANQAGKDEHGITDMPAQVRADGRAPYGSIQRAMQAAAKNGVWKMEFGAAIPSSK
jgi:biopolymer transport protein ExbD